MPTIYPLGLMAMNLNSAVSVASYNTSASFVSDENIHSFSSLFFSQMMLFNLEDYRRLSQPHLPGYLNFKSFLSFPILLSMPIRYFAMSSETLSKTLNAIRNFGAQLGQGVLALYLSKLKANNDLQRNHWAVNHWKIAGNAFMINVLIDLIHYSAIEIEQREFSFISYFSIFAAIHSNFVIKKSKQ